LSGAKPGRDGLYRAPPEWIEALPSALAAVPAAGAAPPRRRARRWSRRTALAAAAATCGLAIAIAIARAQEAPDTGGAGGGGAGAPAGGGGAAAPTGGGAPAGAGPAAGVGGGDVQMGGLRGQLEAAFAAGNPPLAGATTDPAWIITPAISLQEEWTDNALQTSSPKIASLITTVSPSISIAGSTSRLTANLYYSPSIALYSGIPSQNQVGQNLGASGLLTLLPDELYVRANGFAALQSLGAATAPNGTVAVSKQNQVQTYDFSIEPYYTHRFGGWGAMQVGVEADTTTQGLVGAAPGSGNSQSQTTRQELASFTSGENFGRLSSTLQLSASQYNGSGALQGSTSNLASYQGGYAITRGIIALGSIGWEDIKYTGQGALHINDGTWSVGVKLVPNPDSAITLGYGHQDGVTTASVDATYAPSARTRVYVNYTAGYSTDTQQLQNSLAGASFDALGNPVSAQTGAPLQLTNNFYGVNGTVYRTSSLSVTASWLLPRDSFQVSVNRQSQTPVGTPVSSVLGSFEGVSVDGIPITVNAGSSSNQGTYGSLSWQHQVNDALSLSLYFQYGTISTNTPLGLNFETFTLVNLPQQRQNVRLVVGSLGLNYQINRTLSGSLQYSYNSDSFGGAAPPVVQNLVVLGLRKTF
jgi:uncharacterized protein (PEP-CTERM system associated)